MRKHTSFYFGRLYHPGLTAVQVLKSGVIWHIFPKLLFLSCFLVISVTEELDSAECQQWPTNIFEIFFHNRNQMKNCMSKYTVFWVSYFRVKVTTKKDIFTWYINAVIVHFKKKAVHYALFYTPSLLVKIIFRLFLLFRQPVYTHLYIIGPLYCKTHIYCFWIIRQLSHK